MFSEEDIFDIALSHHNNIPSNIIIELYYKYTNSKEIFKNSKEISYLSKNRIRINNSYIEHAKNSIDFMIKAQIELIKFNNLDYPLLLKEIPDKPFILYTRGNKGLLRQDNTISIVGTRNPNKESINITNRLTSLLTEYNFTTVSGLAKGIDYEVHSSTLENKGKTIAVLGSGIDITYPVNHNKLVRDILDKESLIISEYPIGTKPFKKNFPLRNRIIAGLSRDVLIIQAPEKSGSSITGYLAFQYNRNLYVYIPNISNQKNKELEKIDFYDSYKFIEKSMGMAFNTPIEIVNIIKNNNY